MNTRDIDPNIDPNVDPNVDPNIDPNIAKLLARAVAIARASVAAEGGPFGAVIADAAGNIVAEGRNQVTTHCDPTAHAEVSAIRAACASQRDHRLTGLVLFSSCEPCPMCLAAAWWARLDAVWFASGRDAAAAAGFDDAALWRAVSTGNTAPQLTLQQFDIPDAGLEFSDWMHMAARIPY